MNVAAHLSSREDSVTIGRIPPQSHRKCSRCGREGHDRRSCGRPPKARITDPWSDLEWEAHVEARRVVAMNPDGMTLEEVGSYLGVTRERVRQIEASALHKLRTGLESVDTATVGGLTVAIVDCERCAAPFVRSGRVRLCEICSSPPEPKKPKVAKPSPPEPKKPKVAKSRSKARPKRVEAALVRAVPHSPIKLALNLRWR